MASLSFEEAQRIAWLGVLRCQKLAVVEAVLAGHARGLGIVALCDVVQDTLDATHERFNADLAATTRALLDPDAPRAVQ